MRLVLAFCNAHTIWIPNRPQQRPATRARERPREGASKRWSGSDIGSTSCKGRLPMRQAPASNFFPSVVCMADDSNSKTTLEDLAKIAGVSISTVSRALNDHPLISRRTKQRIWALARDHDY